jgi:hypothetical protein
MPYYCYSVAHVRSPSGESLYYYHTDTLQVDVKHANDVQRAWHQHVASLKPGALLAPDLCAPVPSGASPQVWEETLEKSWKDKGAQVVAPDWAYEPEKSQ